MRSSLCGSAGCGAALQLEVMRLREQNAALAGQVHAYAADVAALVSLGRVGHANPKQKLQYNTGWVSAASFGQAGWSLHTTGPYYCVGACLSMSLPPSLSVDWW